MLVERVQKAITEPPEEKKQRDEANGVERFFEGQLGRSCALLVRDAEGAVPPKRTGRHDGFTWLSW